MTFRSMVVLTGVFAAAAVFGALNPGLDPPAPSYCTWLAKTPIGGNDPETVTCVDQCHQICQNNPGEYFCYGYKAHTDTDDHIHDASSTAKYVYCLCHRSIVRRSPGNICGPKGAPCPGLISQESNGFTEGENNMIEGYQGTQLLEIKAKYDNSLATNSWDVDVPCNNTLYSMMRYLFQK